MEHETSPLNGDFGIMIEGVTRRDLADEDFDDEDFDDEDFDDEEYRA